MTKEKIADLMARIRLEYCPNCGQSDHITVQPVQSWSPFWNLRCDICKCEFQIRLVKE